MQIPQTTAGFHLSSATLRPGTCWGQGLEVALAVLGSQLDLRESQGFSSFADSMILSGKVKAPALSMLSPPEATSGNSRKPGDAPSP